MDTDMLDRRIAEIAVDPNLRHDVRWWLIDELLEWRMALVRR